MDIVLGVSMEPAAVRLVLVEGEKADGATVDHDTLTVPTADPAAAAEQVAAAILGTRANAADGGHRLMSTGVVWSDHSAAAELRQALLAHRIDDVVMVSELHAASALAQAIGRAMGADRVALMFLDPGSATLAVVRTRDGSVTRVTSSVGTPELLDQVGRLEGLTDPPQAVFVVGSGVDVSAVKSEIAAVTRLPVHAPLDADLALARGAALASANAPRFEAETVGLASRDDTEAAAGLTQAADAAYMAPLGYSAMPDEDPGDLAEEHFDPDSAEDVREAEPEPFFLVGSALAALFVLGVAALVISLAVTIRPTAEQRLDPGAGTNQAPAAVPPAPETIQAPVPVVQEVPRTVFVAPGRAPVAVVPAPVEIPPAPAPVAPAPAPAPAPEPPPAPAPPAPAPVSQAPAIAPIPIVVPIAPAPVLPPILQLPVRRSPVPVTQAPVTQVPVTQLPVTQSPVTQVPVTQPPVTQVPAPSAPSYTPPATSAPAYTPPATTIPAYTPPATTTPAYTPPATSTPAPAAADSGSGGSGSGQSGASQSGSSPAQSGATTSRNPLWPLWPGFNR